MYVPIGGGENAEYRQDEVIRGSGCHWSTHLSQTDVIDRAPAGR